MRVHGRAELGPAALCQAIERGMSFREAAASLSVSPATAQRSVAAIPRRFYAEAASIGVGV
jgi:hypothetical protein